MSSILLFALGTALAFGLSAYLYTTHSITIGTAYLIVAYTLLLNQPTEQLRTQLQDLQQASASIERVEELLATEPAIRETSVRLLPAIPEGPMAVAFDKVTFSYGGDEPALREISFAIMPGKALGLLGRTGSGKSTITRLLLRTYDPTGGSVCLSGVDLRDASLAQVRGRIGMVTQEVQLFQASVRDNLTFFDESVPDAQLEALLEDVGLGRWLQALPQGLDTSLAASGGGLSAGEAQLLAFARVLLKEPDLVILDEASSRLDPATEQAVQHATERLLRGRTSIIVAHRLATVQHADDILILDAGRVLEYGPRAKLIADPHSHFAQLLRMGMEMVPL
jgi:ATP-binding cassette subfamily B protein